MSLRRVEHSPTPPPQSVDAWHDLNMSPSADTVIDLLAARAAEGSRPGQRADQARLVLLIEGGSSRGAFSSGMAVVIEELGLLDCFDAVYGSSAGALNAAWLLCRRSARNIHGW
jgi:hypothetical protein